MSTARSELLSVSNSRASSSAIESRLPERLGTSVAYRPSELRAEREMAGVVELASEMGSQQKDSLPHSLQLRFSNRRPSSSDAEHLEKTAGWLVQFTITFLKAKLTSPHAKQVLGISCIDFVY
jgi:hypothetical protein